METFLDFKVSKVYYFEMTNQLAVIGVQLASRSLPTANCKLFYYLCKKINLCRFLRFQPYPLLMADTIMPLLNYPVIFQNMR